MNLGREHGKAHTRREILKLGGGAALLAMAGPGLAACGGSSGSSPSGSTAGSGGTVPTASGTVNFLGYEGDDFQPIFKAWKTENGVTWKSSYISDESELFPKIKNGTVAADLISCTNLWAPYLEQAGIVTPLDASKIPNLANVWPFFSDAPKGFFKNDDGDWITVPAYFGGLGIAWDSTVVPNVTSWNDILDPAFTGKVGMIDFPAIHLLTVATIKGFDSSKMSQANLQTFKDYMIPVVKQAKTVTASFGDLISLLGSKEIAAVFPGYTFIAGGAEAAGNKDVKLNIDLTDGQPLAIEMYAIPPNAKNTDAAYAFMNEQLQPAIAAKIAAAQGSIVTVKNGVAKLDPATKALYPYDDLDAYLGGAAVLANPPVASSDYVTAAQVDQAWAEIKQQAGA